jgi:lysozyme family protein
MTFDDAITEVLQHEGGYVNHPSDPGSETNHGVTLKVARENGYLGEMRDMPVSVAKAIYKARYWDKARCDDLPPELRFDVFDCAVNSGVGTAIKLLQRALRVNDDGQIGPQTIAAAQSQPVYRTLGRMAGARLNLMTNLNHWDQFGRGWARRIAKNLMEIV